MKYLKFLIIPIFMIMFIVPVKADTIELPDEPRIDNPSYEYVIIEYYDYDELRYSLHIAPKGFNFTYTNKVLRIHSLDRTNNFYWMPGDLEWRTNKQNVLNARYDWDFRSGVKIVYSSQDIYDSSDSLVFHKTPVSSLAKLQQKSLENLGTEVQGASWRISAAGGLILGAVLVTHLVTRLRRWVTV